MQKVSVVIPNWNGRALLEKNLPKVLEAKDNKKNKISEVIIVDDGSTDDSVHFLKKEFGKSIRLIRLSENRGFGSAVNMGVRMSNGNLICLLNTDVIPSANFLEKALPHFKKKEVFGISLHEKGFGNAIGIFKNGFVEHKGGTEGDNVKESFWVSGGSGIFRRDVWMKLKGFDEALYNPFYWEDVDICYRAQKRGYICLWEPESNVVHKHESVINPTYFRTRYLNLIKERNHLLFVWKNITSPILFKKHLRALAGRLLRHPGYARIVFAALKKRKVLQKRRENEEKRATVSDETVFARFSKWN